MAYAHPQAASSSAKRVDVYAWALLIGRACFAADFILFGSRKFSDPSIIYNLIEAHRLPGGLVYPTIVLQIGCGLLVLLGLQTRIAAAALGWFCIVAPSIFWSDHLEHLSRDYAAAGGFMLLVLFGPGPLSLDARWRQLRDPVAYLIPAVVESQKLINAVMLLARVLIAFPFLGDVVKKSLHLDGQISLYNASGFSSGIMYFVMTIELACGLAVLIGFRTRLAALVLLALTAAFALSLRNPGYDFAIFSGDFSQAMVKNFYNRNAASFFKDVTTIGALLMLWVYGPGEISRDGADHAAAIDQMLRRSRST